MNNPMNNGGNPGNGMQGMQQMMGQFQSFMSNPMQALTGKFNIPQNLANNPAGMVQHLLDSGQMTQQQYSQLQNMANQLQQNPLFAQFMRRK